MNIALISYGEYDYDGRLRELYNTFSKIGTVNMLSRGNKECSNTHILFRSNNYIKFILEAIRFVKKMEDLDILVLDNRRAALVGLFLKKENVVIQDCRELYDINDVKHFVGKIGCIIEKKMIEKSDIIICANKERAEKMEELFDLERKPIVFENLRKLKYSSENRKETLKEKYSDIIKKDEIRIISSSGCSVDRTNDILVKNLKNINEQYKTRLILVGENSGSDYETIKKLLKDNEIGNVTILGKIEQDDLKYLISNSHIGVVNYSSVGLNNSLCASGKLYEFMYEGIPVITTSNLPLKNICEEYGVGVADDTYYKGINEIICNYDMYVNNVLNFIKYNTVEKNNERFISTIRKEINRICT